MTEKVSIEQNTQNSTLVSDPTADPTRDANPSTEGVFCHSVPPAAAAAQDSSTEAVICHSVAPAEATEQHPSTEVAKYTSDPSM